MTELQLHTRLAWGVIATGAVVFVTLFFVVAPYGRHTRSGWGFVIPERVGWIVMESPAVLGFAAIYLQGQHARETVPLCLAAMWLTHYVHRACIYPFRMKGRARPMPVSIPAMAIVFNGINAYLNARWISELGHYDGSWATDPRFIVGGLLFAGGMVLNVRSDNILFRLRQQGDSTYRIPFGGPYRWVSSPNYLGELIEWGGFAVATWSLAALAFFLFTGANLVPRAISNHRWYREQFPDYPGTRRAILPWVL